jgi:hypothetical protein
VPADGSVDPVEVVPVPVEFPPLPPLAVPVSAATFFECLISAAVGLPRQSNSQTRCPVGSMRVAGLAWAYR